MKNSLNLFAFTFLLSIAACNNAQKSNDAEDVKDIEKSIRGEELSYSTDSTNMNGYISYDANQEGKRPGVLVVHEWWGHNEYVRQRADMLADLGYVALAVDMYGDGKQANHPDDAGKFVQEVVSNIDEAKARFESAMTALKSNENVDPERIAAIGYCFGGSVVLSMANAGYDLDAVAAFHAGVALPIPPSEDIMAKILVANGADDPFIPKESIVAYKAQMDKVGANYEYVTYEGAVHGFTSPMADSLGVKFELPLAYNEKADTDSWNKLKELLSSVF